MSHTFNVLTVLVQCAVLMSPTSAEKVVDENIFSRGCTFSDREYLHQFEGSKTISTGELFLSKEKADFFTAFKQCKSIGAELAVVMNQKENDEILSHIAPLKENFYISATDLGSEGEFYWMSTGHPMIFNAWTAKEPGYNNPDNYQGIEHCVHYRPYGKENDYFWNDILCDKKMRFLCQKRNPYAC